MKKHDAQLQFDTLAIEGGLFTAEWLGKVASFKAPGQSDADYGMRAGFSTREEIALAWRSAQHLWGQFKSARNQSGFDTWAVSQRFVTELLRQSFGFATLRAAEHPQEIDGRRYPVSHFAHGQAVPLVVSDCTEPKPLDTAHDRLGDNSGERLRRRSTFGLLQEYVNAADDALWGIEDYWAVPREFVLWSGDCEDYATTKYYALRFLGVPAKDMRITAVWNKQRGEGHAVLIVYVRDKAYVLDNFSDKVLPREKTPYYVPVFSVNEEGMWVLEAEEQKQSR